VKAPLGKNNRREFLKTTLIAGAAGLSAVPLAAPAAQVAAPVDGPGSAAAARRAHNESGPIGTAGLAAPDAAHVLNPGSDFMVDLLKAAGIRYVTAIPGATFRGLHESIVNYGGNVAPELISCVHEEISAAMCHGYAKVAGEPIACLVHSNVGLQHASMAIYNCWADRAPMIVLVGNSLDAADRRPGVEWLHSMADAATIVRDYVKWDDVPVSLQHYSDSFMRAREMTVTAPYEPVLLVVDSSLQERSIPDRAKLSIARRAPVSPPAGNPSAIDMAAELLVAAKTPVIAVDRLARTPEGVALLVQLAELLGAPVIDLAGRMNMPSNHYLNQSFRQRELIAHADVILGLEMTDLWGVVYAMTDIPERVPHRIASEECKVIGISANYGFMRGNVQDVERYFAADLAIDADGQTCLPQLIEGVNRRLTDEKRRAIAAKIPGQRADFNKMRAAAAEDAARSWDATPVGTGRLCMEIWQQIKHLNWALVSNSAFISSWPQRLWDITEHHQYIGGEGGYGVGYGAPAAAGAALAHRDAERIPIAIQCDGDFLMAPGTLWTLAHHKIPLLTVMHNNRAWHQESMHLQRMADRRNRSADTWSVGTVLDDPPINYSAIATGMGIWAEGPIADPKDLAPAIARALAIVKRGKPALLDVITQPR
jgi:acetolactate synthase I/II/III large subunit